MLTRWGKFWIAATALSLFLYELRLFYGNVLTVYFQLQLSAPFADYPLWRFLVDRVLSGLTGNVIRLAGSILALSVLFLLWRKKPASFENVRRRVSAALLCEATYWLLVLPISLIELIFLQRAPFVEVAVMIQIILAGSLLTVLAARVQNYTEQNKMNTLKWASMAAIGYLVAIWCSNIFRWFSMAQVTSIGFILTGETGVGFLSAVVPLSVSLIFAVVSFYSMFEKQNTELAIRMAGASLIFLGLYFIIYLAYSALTNSLSFVFLVEFWPITVLGLGVGMLRGKI